MLTVDHVAAGLANGKKYTRIVQGFGKIVFTKEDKEFFVRREEDGEVLFSGESEGEVTELVNEHLGDSMEDVTQEGGGSLPPLPPPPLPKANTEVKEESKGEEEQAVSKAEPEAPAEKKETKPKKKGYRAQVFGHSVTAVIRWLGKQGFSEEETYAALREQLGESLPSVNTVKIQLSWGANDKKEIPALTEEEGAILLKHKK